MATQRIEWAATPEAVRRTVESTLGSHVVEAVNQRGGYGPGLAARCVLADGRSVFIKAVSPALNPDSPEMMRREAVVAAALPAAAPAPKLLHAIDDGTWIVLVFEAVDGAVPSTPWRPDELDAVLAAARAVAHLPHPASLPTVQERFGPMFGGWRTLESARADAIDDAWCRAHVSELADLERQWGRAASGHHLVHGDFRSDNLLVRADGHVVVVDWGAACVGASWFDVVLMLPSLELEGAGPPEAVLARAGLSDLADDLVVPVVAACAGYFAHRAPQPDPPGLPTLRAFQRAQGEVTVAWLQRLLGA